MTRKSIHIKPVNKGWELKRSGSHHASGVYRTKEEATKAGRRIAREQDLDLVIYEKASRFTNSRGAAPKRATDGRKETIKRLQTAVSRQSKTLSRSSELSPQEKAQAWREWAASHSRKTPLLSDEAISRESIYGERG